MANADKFGVRLPLRPPKHGYTLLLVALLTLWIVAPLAHQAGLERGINIALVTLLVIAAIYVMSDKPRISRWGVTLAGILLAILLWADAATNAEPAFHLGANLVGLLFFAVVAWQLLVDILSKSRRVDAPLINGAISVYLLLGVAFEFVYGLILAVDPTAFRGLVESGAEIGQFFYFSFVTLTTLGYGDITPASRLAGAVATLEAMIGQIYLTVLVARLVGMHISQATSD